MKILNEKCYTISIWTKRGVYVFEANSVKTALMIAKLPFWDIVKVCDFRSSNCNGIETIYYRRKTS